MITGVIDGASGSSSLVVVVVIVIVVVSYLLVKIISLILPETSSLTCFFDNGQDLDGHGGDIAESFRARSVKSEDR